MYSGGAPKRSGDFMFPELQMANWAYDGEAGKFDVYDTEWYQHIMSIQRECDQDLAHPAIYNKRLVLRGGLKPEGEIFPQLYHEYVFTKNGEYIHAPMADIKMVTTEQYNKYFKKLYETTPPTIRTRARSKGRPLPKSEQYAIVIFKRRLKP